MFRWLAKRITKERPLPWPPSRQCRVYDFPQTVQLVRNHEISFGKSETLFRSPTKQGEPK